MSTTELTILMPCLNEAATIETCIRKAKQYLARQAISGEIVIADNGSSDGSQALSERAGARVVHVQKRGYGAALIGGIYAAQGRYVIMADADDSYDFSRLDGFLDRLRSGFQLVIGNRFSGTILPGAMPLLNRYLGNPVLSFIGRSLFASPVGDFHCGIRGFDRNAILELKLRASGMEFASEMIVKASLANLKITEIPTTLSPDGRRRKPHLRPWRDGLRHLRFMILRSPQWLFLYPGLSLALAGSVGAVLLMLKPRLLFGFVTLDINALLYVCIGVIVGLQIAYFGLIALTMAKRLNLRTLSTVPALLSRWAASQYAIALGAILVVGGLGETAYAIAQWGHLSFGALVPSKMMRLTIPAVTALAVGLELLFNAFLLGFIDSE